MSVREIALGLLMQADDEGGSTVKKKPWEYPAEWLPFKEAADRQMTFLVNIGIIGQYFTIEMEYFDTIVFEKSGNTAYTIDWGDGETTSRSWNDLSKSTTAEKHVYQRTGQFRITVDMPHEIIQTTENYRCDAQMSIYCWYGSYSAVCLACCIGDNCRFSSCSSSSAMYIKVKLSDLKNDTGLNSLYCDVLENEDYGKGYQRGLYNLIGSGYNTYRIDFTGNPQVVKISCQNLMTLTGVDYVVSYPDYGGSPMLNTNNLQTISFPNVETLKKSAIYAYGCTTTIKLPICKKIENGAISGGYALTDIYVAEGCEIEDGALPADYGNINVHYN